MPDRAGVLNRRLLDEFQRDFPLVPAPFAAMAESLETSEANVIVHLRMLQAQGQISRVGATIRPNTVGASTLAAISAPPSRIEEVAEVIGEEPGVNHSYLREDEWNLWFVATAPDAWELRQMLDRIAARSGLAVLDLRLERAFNIDLGFRLSGEQPPRAARPVLAHVLSEADRPLLQALADGLPLVPRPYAALASDLAMDEAGLLRRIASLVEASVISRLGVIVRHRALGWTANAMVAWDVPAERIAETGEIVARQPGVTLCYQRRTVPGVWPFGLFNMIHARSRKEASDVIATLRALPELAGVAHRVLFSTRCFKQTGAFIHRREVAA